MAVKWWTYLFSKVRSMLKYPSQVDDVSRKYQVSKDD